MVGLPPQVRGRAPALRAHPLAPRTTPAGAGTSAINRSRYPLTPDYPRRCGDEFRGMGQLRGHVGLPPQVRGRGGHLAFLGGVCRTTPAGAGTRNGRVLTSDK